MNQFSRNRAESPKSPADDVNLTGDFGPTLRRQEVALWLMPARETREILSPIVAELADRFAVPRFPPHVTAFVGGSNSSDDVHATAQRIADKFGPINLTVRGVGHSDRFFKALYLTFADSGTMAGLSDAMRNSLGEHQDYDLQPHLSLIYKNLSAKVRLQLAREIQIGHPAMRFDEIQIVRPGVGGWDNFREWKMEFSAKLSS